MAEVPGQRERNGVPTGGDALESAQHENCDVTFCLHREHMRSANVI